MAVTHDEMVTEIQDRAAAYGLLSHYCQRSTTCKGSRGMPDLIVAGIGGAVFLEVKTPGHGPVPDQTTWIYTLRAGGQVVMVVRGADLVDGTLDRILAACTWGGRDG